MSDERIHAKALAPGIGLKERNAYAVAFRLSAATVLNLRGSGSAAEFAWNFCIDPTVGSGCVSTEAVLWRTGGPRRGACVRSSNRAVADLNATCSRSAREHECSADGSGSRPASSRLAMLARVGSPDDVARRLDTAPWVGETSRRFPGVRGFGGRGLLGGQAAIGGLALACELGVCGGRAGRAVAGVFGGCG